MKQTLIFSVFLLVLATAGSMQAAPAQDPAALFPSELATLDQLIAVTQRNVEAQRLLRCQLIDYQQLQTRYLRNPDDKDVLFRLIKTAQKAMNTIKNEELTHLFSSEFLSELNLFAQIGSKRGVPKP